MDIYLADPVRDPTAPFVGHPMSPTATAVLLLLAVVVDYMSVGPNSVRDRMAFLLALPAIRVGFDGSPLDAWTVGLLSGVIDGLKEAAGAAYIAGAVTSVVLGAAVGILAIYAVGALLPAKASKRLGRFATIRFPQSAMYRINWKLWIFALLLGMLADLTKGSVGSLLTSALDVLSKYAGLLPGFLFGVDT